MSKASRGSHFQTLSNSCLSILGTILPRVFQLTKSISTQDQNNLAKTLAGESSAGIWGATFKFSGSRTQGQTNSTTVVRELAVASPTDSKVLDLCEQNGLVLLIDELHRGDSGLVNELSAFVKAASNRPCKNFKVILLGTATDASRLVVRDPGIDRILQEVELPGFEHEEATSLVLQGMEKLRISIDSKYVESLVRVSVGSPALTQYLSLEVADAAFVRDPRVVAEDDVSNAVKSYIRKKAKRLEDSYLKAIETTGPRRYRKQILHAMAGIGAEYVTMDQLVEQVSKQVGEEVPSTTLSGPLRDLKSESHGKVLRDVERKEGTRVFNYTTFSDPTMKAFLRMRLEGEKKGFVKEA